MPHRDAPPAAVLTHLEVAHLVGSQRTRERWENKGLLPPARWVRGFGRAIGLYPGITLARLAGGSDAGEYESAVRAVMQEATALLASPLFDEVVDCVATLVAERQTTGLTRELLGALEEAGVLGRLTEAGVAIANTQRDAGIVMTTRLAHILDELDESVLVDDGGERVSYPRAVVLGRVKAGAAVAVERVRVGPQSHEYVLPLVAAERSVQPAAAITPQDWEEAFGALRGRRPIAVVAVPDEEDQREGADIPRPRPRHVIRMPRELYDGANSMVRP
jgi:hypothetical protein